MKKLTASVSVLIFIVQSILPAFILTYSLNSFASTAPALELSRVTWSSVMLRYNVPLSSSVQPNASDFSFTLNGAPLNTPFTVSIEHGDLYVYIQNTFSSTDIVTITYIPGINPSGITDFSGNNVEALVGQPLDYVDHPSCLIVMDIPSAECEGLMALYENTDGPNWINNDKWGVSRTVCDNNKWYGVFCENGHVTKLNLSGNKLNGSIPAAFGNLTFLKQLIIGGSNITIDFPPEMSQLVNLESISLSASSINTLPVNIALVPNLKHLNLSNNHLSTLPAEFVAFTNLTDLFLNNNLFTEIPEVVFDMTNLQFLGMGNNSISSIPSDISNLVELDFLNLNSNLLTSLPLEIGSLGLEFLYISDNNFTSFPVGVLDLHSLTTLFVGDNGLTSIPDSISSLISLENLYLYGNRLTTIPEGVLKSSSLRLLDIHDNILTSIPAEISNLTQLYSLDVGINQLTTLPAEIGNLPNLIHLRLYNNHINTLPAEIANLDTINYGDPMNNIDSLNTSVNCLSPTTLTPAVITWLNTYDSDWASQQTGGCVTGVSSAAVDGNHTAGAVIPVTVSFRGNVDTHAGQIMSGEVTLGTARIAIETGPTDTVAEYASGSGTNTLTFNYTIGADDASTDLDYIASSALTFYGGSLMVKGNPVSLLLPTPGTAGSLGANKNITINVRTLDVSTPVAPVTSSIIPVNISVSNTSTTPTLDLHSLITAGTGTLPAITITAQNASNTTVAIPASTTITSSNPAWDGILDVPTVTTITLPSTAGQTKTLALALSMGDTASRLTFDKAVRIFLPGQAGKIVGYSHTGTDFTDITTVCTVDLQATIDMALPAGGDCKMDTGSDLVIWTKHFTTFATYTQVSTPVSSGGGGGGGGGGGFSPTPTAVMSNTAPQISNIETIITKALKRKSDKPSSRKDTVALSFMIYGGKIESEYVCKKRYTDIVSSRTSSQTCQLAEKAQDAGLISSTNTEFKPLTTISRSEAYSMMMKSVCIHPATTATNWQTEVAKQAIKLGFTTRTLDTFEPNRPLTSFEMYTVASQVNIYAKAHPESCQMK